MCVNENMLKRCLGMCYYIHREIARGGRQRYAEALCVSLPSSSANFSVDIKKLSYLAPNCSPCNHNFPSSAGSLATATRKT